MKICSPQPASGSPPDSFFEASQDATFVALFAHPDDEFAVLPLLAALTARGQRIMLCWLTDGGFNGVPPDVRRAESIRVLAEWKVDSGGCRFIGAEIRIPDGQLHLNISRALEALHRCLADCSGPIKCLIPAWEGGHQDHDVVHVLGRYIRRSRANVTLIQYPLYNGEGLVGPFFKVLNSLSEMSIAFSIKFSVFESVALLRACARYRSQWRTFLGLTPLIAWRLLVVRKVINFCHVRQLDPCVRPHAGPLLYERRANLSWAEIRESVKDYW